jgi:hypothetical protein
MSWKDELAKRFSNSHWWSVLNDSNHGRKGLISFIEKLLEKERKETEQRVATEFIEEFDRISLSIQDEITSMKQYPNIGKKGCVARIELRLKYFREKYKGE